MRIPKFDHCFQAVGARGGSRQGASEVQLCWEVTRSQRKLNEKVARGHDDKNGCPWKRVNEEQTAGADILHKSTLFPFQSLILYFCSQF